MGEGCKYIRYQRKSYQAYQVSKERLLAIKLIIAWTRDMLGILIPSPSDVCVIPDNLKRDRAVRRDNDRVISFTDIGDTSKPVVLN